MPDGVRASRRAGSDGQRPAVAPSAAAARPLRIAERPGRRRTARRRARGGRAGSCSRRPGTPTRSASRCGSAAFRARESPRAERRRSVSSVRVRREQRGDAVVGVLVDDDDAEGGVRLRRERAEEPLQVVRPVDGRDDEVDARSCAAAATGAGYPHARRGPPARVRRARRPRRGARRSTRRCASVLGQTLGDLELVVVDDGSATRRASSLAAVDDPRLRVVRNDAPLGLAGALNVGLDEARGTLRGAHGRGRRRAAAVARAARRPHRAARRPPRSSARR